ncbi:3'-5' exonuclease [Capnocytophaga catalasegens]|uniref:3'-5' exonuclease n=1 Tax=Capnocytophaga catalasegens TaxID=1004260 RepID=A0AAV5APP3_9FLAO|nr:3'-5' exonuclease [Capnocytophaga catalasegens]GIZ14940.1 3'-5' exonuclease [Capnocytophaga catalasegens]GJM49319.1 3'-5' exonuclease [Capnocytophaga catalasegens]GJM52470.1 3'-5' exonuclease [Capnocytophaga catalasegens]
MQIARLNLTQILFLDIETVPLYANYNELPQEEQILWEEKTRYQRQELLSAEDFYERAGILAEFGKIVCISVGYFWFKAGERQFRVRSFVGDELRILQDFSNLLQMYFSQSNKLLCAHNGKEFDFPFIARRMIINRLPLPELLNLFGRKPWEVPHLDTLELWKFGDYKHYTSLQLLAYILGVPSPKEDIKGSDVRHVFYLENNIDRIRTYCEKDTITVAQIFLRLRNESLLTPDEIYDAN